MFIAPNPESLSFQIADATRILLACLFLFIALSSMWRWKQITEDFKRWRLPQFFKSLLVIWQLVSALALLSQSTSLFAALSLMLMMNGAFFIHLKYDEIKDSISPFIILALAAFVAWEFKIEPYETLRNKAMMGNIQSCIVCHSNPDLAPALESQSYDYLWEQVKNFQNGNRGSETDSGNGNGNG